MRITIIYDNESGKEGLKADWGFSCLVETDERKILFDTGANGSILLENMKVLDIDPTAVDDVFISHTHFDHIGGLSAFLNKNSNVVMYVPASLRGIRSVKEIVYVDKPIQIMEHVNTTGLLKDIEQSLVIQTTKGSVIVVGCSHPGLGDILKAAARFGEPYAIIGGLHGFREFTLIEQMQTICPTHCTEHILEIKSLYPGKYIPGGAGEVITI